MENQDKLSFAKEIVQNICKVWNFKYDIEVHFTDNINSEKLKYLKRDYTIKKYREMDQSNMNGIALPFECNGFHIIINNKNQEFYFTIFHECSHIIDYYEFMNKFNNGKIEIEQNPFYFTFGYYSEFNARFVAHYSMLKLYANNDNNFKKDVEIDTLRQLITNLHENFKIEVSNEKFYELMQLLGRWFSIEYATQKEYELPYFKNLYILLHNFHKNKSLDNLTKLDYYFRNL